MKRNKMMVFVLVRHFTPAGFHPIHSEQIIAFADLPVPAQRGHRVSLQKRQGNDRKFVDVAIPQGGLLQGQRVTRFAANHVDRHSCPARAGVQHYLKHRRPRWLGAKSKHHRFCKLPMPFLFVKQKLVSDVAVCVGGCSQ